MHINLIQAVLLGIFACLSSMPGLGGTTIGNYTLGRPLVAGLVVGIILGDIKSGIIVGAAIQVIYIALVTPGGTVSADVRAISYRAESATNSNSCIFGGKLLRGFVGNQDIFFPGQFLKFIHL